MDKLGTVHGFCPWKGGGIAIRVCFAENGLPFKRAGNGAEVGTSEPVV